MRTMILCAVLIFIVLDYADDIDQPEVVYAAHRR